MNLRQLFKTPLQTVPNKIVIFLFVVALIGFIDAGYLTLEHYQGRIPPCTTNANCDLVLNSSYSQVAGIPVSLAGTVYYFLVLIGVFAYLESKKKIFLQGSLLLTIVGLLASLWFVYIQVFVIYSYCLYCLGSALTSTILFVTAMEIFEKYQNK
jgi:uncharacterized membrane protein